MLVVHDLTPLTRPRHHTLANRFCFNAYFAESLAAATAVVCVSEATRRRLERFFPRAGAAARVVGNGVDAFFAPPADAGGAAAIRDRLAGGRPFIVQLGTLEPRKGIATLLAAHAELLRRASRRARPRARGRPGVGRAVAGAGARRATPNPDACT